jgi:hypothetical protein
MLSQALRATWKRNAPRFLRSNIKNIRAVSLATTCQHQHQLLRHVKCHNFSATTTTTSVVPNVDGSNHKNDMSSLILSLPAPYLRNMARFNFDEQTHQRNDVKFNIHNGKPLATTLLPEKYSIQDCVYDGSEFVITFGDGLFSKYSLEWVQRTLQKWQHPPLFSKGCVLWTHLTESTVRQSSSLSLDFDQILTERGMKAALRALYQYGIVLVRNTPTEDEGAGIAALAAAVSGGSNKDSTEASLWRHYQTNTSKSTASSGNRATVLTHGTDGPLRTLYGVIWSTSTTGQLEGTSVADSAYGHDALPLHTDMSYHRDPPGLQIFTMRQPAPRGGESVFADGFAVANRLNEMHPTAFDTLSTVVRTYCCIDQDTGWNLQARGSVIALQNGVVSGIRHNDLDRLVDLPPPSSSTEQEKNRFYAQLTHAHEIWDDLLSRDEFRLVMSLQPGETMVVANQVRSEQNAAYGSLRRSQTYSDPFVALLAWKAQI